MIKADSGIDEQKAEQPKNAHRRNVLITLLSFIVLVGIVSGSYLLINSSPSQITGNGIKGDNMPTLQIGHTSSFPSGTINYQMANGLATGTFNLQGNAPVMQSNNQFNGLQSSGYPQNSVQSINENLPY